MIHSIWVKIGDTLYVERRIIWLRVVGPGKGDFAYNR